MIEQKARAVDDRSHGKDASGIADITKQIVQNVERFGGNELAANLVPGKFTCLE
jgi:hypothetical protein